MNWFERYGIPGIYFVLLLAVFYWIISGCLPIHDLAAFGAALSVSIPLGYILVILSQFLYYTISPWQVHLKAWENAGEKAEKRKEWWVETEATILDRLECHENKVEKGRWIQDWFMKRFDVLTINSALMLATIIGWILGVLGLYFLRSAQRAVNSNHLLVFGVISCLILLILICNTCILTKQARRIATEYYKHLRNKSRVVTLGGNR